MGPSGTSFNSIFLNVHLPIEDILINEFIFIKHIDLSGVRFDYLRDIGNIVSCRMHGTIFDEMSNINGIFGSDFRDASFVKATLQGRGDLHSGLVPSVAQRRQIKALHPSFFDPGFWVEPLKGGPLLSAFARILD